MKLLPTLLLIPFFFLISCNRADDVLDGPEIQADISRTFAEEFALSYGETVLIEPEPLMIRFVDVADSRCPLNVECIWAGIVTVQLEVAYRSREMSALLTLGDTEESRSIEFDGIRITLIEVLPYPEEPGTMDKEVYSIQLIVDKD